MMPTPPTRSAPPPARPEGDANAEDEPLRPTLDEGGATATEQLRLDDGDAATADMAPRLDAGDAVTTEMAPLDAGDAVTTEVAPPPRRTSRAVWVLLGAILAAALIGPLVFWLVFWRFEPTAQRHIPAGTVLAVRADARALFLFGPFREHVMPALTPPATDPTRPAMLDRVRTHTGVDLRRDVREIVLATPDAARWAILLGGRFQTSARKGPFIDGFEQAIEAEPGAADWARKDDVLVGPMGAAVAQADDGTILLTSTADLARASVHATDDYRELWLSSAGDISFSLGHPALLHLGIAARGGFPEAAVLERAERITGWVVLGERESKVVLDVVPMAGEPVEPFGASIEALVKTLVARLAAPPPDAASDHAAARALGAVVLGGAKVQTRAASVLITSKAPGPELAAACRELGVLLLAVRAR